MYAVIQTGGKQYKCSPNDIITVERLETQPGKPFSFKDVLLVADGDRVEIGSPRVKGAEVICEVLGEEKGKKTKKVVLVITDGNDNTSLLTLEKLLEKAHRNEITSTPSAC